MNSANRLVCRHRGKVAVVLTACTALTACSGTDEAQSLSAQEVATRYSYDATSAQYTPVFALVPEFQDPMTKYATDLWFNNCTAGVSERVTSPPAPPTGTEQFDVRTSERRWTVEVAAQWGYQGYPADSLMTERFEDGVTPEQYTETYNACSDEWQSEYDEPQGRTLNAIVAAGRQAAQDDPAVLAAIDAWSSCMAPIGIADLPDTPESMPPPSVATVAPQSANGTIPAPTQRETEVAVADAQCRDSSGYLDAVFAARVDAELTAIGRDVEAFEADRRAFADFGEKMQEIINEFG